MNPSRPDQTRAWLGQLAVLVLSLLVLGPVVLVSTYLAYDFVFVAESWGRGEPPIELWQKALAACAWITIVGLFVCMVVACLRQLHRGWPPTGS